MGGGGCPKCQKSRSQVVSWESTLQLRIMYTTRQKGDVGVSIPPGPCYRGCCWGQFSGYFSLLCFGLKVELRGICQGHCTGSPTGDGVRWAASNIEFGESGRHGKPNKGKQSQQCPHSNRVAGSNTSSDNLLQDLCVPILEV